MSEKDAKELESKLIEAWKTLFYMFKTLAPQKSSRVVEIMDMEGGYYKVRVSIEKIDNPYKAKFVQ